MDWIKVNTSLPRSPKVVRLATLMGVSEREALGLALEWFCWLDSATADGCTGLSKVEVDRIFTCHASCVTGVSRFSDALAQIGWIFEDENGIIFASNFDQHNGESAKKRAQATKRQNTKREKECHANSVTGVSRKLRDQRREEKSIYNKHPNGSLNSVCGGDDAAEVDPDGVDALPKRLSIPSSSDEVLTFLSAQPNCGLRGEELLTCAEAFFNELDAVGWTMRGQPVQNWHSAARSYLARWQGNLANRAAAAPRGGKITYRSETQQNYEL